MKYESVRISFGKRVSRNSLFYQADREKQQKEQLNQPEGSVGNLSSFFSAFRLTDRNALVFC
jgi:hypothetical protein